MEEIAVEANAPNTHENYKSNIPINSKQVLPFALLRRQTVFKKLLCSCKAALT
jgi:hypothetical protein